MSHPSKVEVQRLSRVPLRRTPYSDRRSSLEDLSLDSQRTTSTPPSTRLYYAADLPSPRPLTQRKLAELNFLLKYRDQGGSMREYWQGRIDALVAEFGKPDEASIIWEEG